MSANYESHLTITIGLQGPNTMLEFDKRSKEVIVGMAEQGLNAALYYENPDPKTYISMVPTSAHSGDGMGNLMALLVQYSQSRVRTRRQYSVGRLLVEKVLLYIFCKFPFLAWAAWQLQYITTACGTLRKHFTKPFLQVASPECTGLIWWSWTWPCLSLICMFHHLAQLPRQFCQISICPKRTGQTMEVLKFKSTKPRSATTIFSL